MGESGAGYVANLWNYLSPWSKQAGITEEEHLRTGFYNSTNAVDEVVNRKSGIINTIQGPRPVNSDALINFVTDGTLKYDKNSKQSIIEALQTAYYGVQILSIEKQTIQDKTKQAIDNLISKYKSNGGSNDFDKISQYYKTKK
ncbi:MAG TPA: hypothetical protein VMU83_22555 [Hanamia sp.]|nr:hypothetical protein [Hanamia sp.]